jgi:hypothetical protein
MNEEVLNILSSVQEDLDTLLKDLEKIEKMKTDFDDTLKSFKENLVNILLSKENLL